MRKKYKCTAENRRKRVELLKAELKLLLAEREQHGKYWHIAQELKLKKDIRDAEWIARRAEKEVRAVVAAKAQQRANKVNLSKLDKSVAGLVQLTKAERDRLDRQHMLPSVDERMARQLIMDERAGGYSMKLALEVAQERVRVIEAMPIKMRLTLEKMELKLLRRRIAATTI